MYVHMHCTCTYRDNKQITEKWQSLQHASNIATASVISGQFLICIRPWLDKHSQYTQITFIWLKNISHCKAYQSSFILVNLLLIIILLITTKLVHCKETLTHLFNTNCVEKVRSTYNFRAVTFFLYFLIIFLKEKLYCTFNLASTTIYTKPQSF